MGRARVTLEWFRVKVEGGDGEGKSGVGIVLGQRGARND
jgi:hypothetical protein